MSGLTVGGAEKASFARSGAACMLAGSCRALTPCHRVHRWDPAWGRRSRRFRSTSTTPPSPSGPLIASASRPIGGSASRPCRRAFHARLHAFLARSCAACAASKPRLNLSGSCAQAKANSCAQKLPAGTVEALFNASVGDEEGQVRLDYLRCRRAPVALVRRPLAAAWDPLLCRRHRPVAGSTLCGGFRDGSSELRESSSSHARAPPPPPARRIRDSLVADSENSRGLFGRLQARLGARPPLPRSAPPDAVCLAASLTPPSHPATHARPHAPPLLPGRRQGVGYDRPRLRERVPLYPRGCPGAPATLASVCVTSALASRPHVCSHPPLRLTPHSSPPPQTLAQGTDYDYPAFRKAAQRIQQQLSARLTHLSSLRKIRLLLGAASSLPAGQGPRRILERVRGGAERSPCRASPRTMTGKKSRRSRPPSPRPRRTRRRAPTGASRGASAAGRRGSGGSSSLSRRSSQPCGRTPLRRPGRPGSVRVRGACRTSLF